MLATLSKSLGSHVSTKSSISTQDIPSFHCRASRQREFRCRLALEKASRITRADCCELSCQKCLSDRLPTAVMPCRSETRWTRHERRRAHPGSKRFAARMPPSDLLRISCWATPVVLTIRPLKSRIQDHGLARGNLTRDMARRSLTSLPKEVVTSDSQWLN